MAPKIPGMASLQNFTTKTPSKKMQCGDITDGLKNDLIIRAARGEKTERTPVWVMRQAGRYLPEFRKLREEHEFFECCRTPELASEITIQPIRRYEGLIDAAVIFSDILVVPQAMGLEVEMVPGKGPSFPNPLVSPKDFDRLKKVDVHRDLGYVMEAIKLTRHKLNGRVPVIGFCGAPWTLMAYMIEGGGSKSWDKAKKWLFDHPNESKVLLERIASVCAQFLVAQIQAGAQLIQVFDSWAGELTPADFRTFALPYLKSIAVEVRDTLACTSTCAPPMIVFAKGALGHSMNELIKSGYDVIGLDHTVEPITARKAVEDCLLTSGKFAASAGNREAGHRIALQGNLDPAVLYASPAVIEERVERMLRGKSGFGGSGALICNLGHGITPGVDPENLGVFLKAVRRISKDIQASDS
ncbi:uroporphyrinogen decarboxylase [Malassezia japonica]|uniref:Uroporphyrinogen decarboxylase n=1 Tax=Malassezia japonica TaxID=223818 RepID=A0AAF0F8N7_9BASI|nr:uroporphyrinogen decarboxylase [Malassezia japonica]WFD40327.1 uroporphyrinogen decarboxylase [Malassezia japonica]